MATQQRDRLIRKFVRNNPRKPRLGSGARFAAVERSARAGGARDPAAVAAAVGRAKYGKQRMAQLAAAGRRRA